MSLNSSITNCATGSLIDIELIQHDKFSQWLETKDSATKTWVHANNYSGKGYLTIPNEKGEIASCIYTIPENADFFIAGDLANQLPENTYTLNLGLLDSLDSCTKQQIHENFTISWGLSSYQFDRYKSTDLNKAQLYIDNDEIFQKAVDFIESIKLVRDLINTPASDMMPDDLTATCIKLCETHTAQLKVLVGDQLLEQNYPTIHAVGRASIHEPRLLDLNWGHEDAPKVTLVGKGVCFDSGGLDLKPSSAMRLMKKDMGGAAHVLGLAKLIMSRELPIRLRVLVPAVENAVSSNAFRPGDVLTTRQGITVEIDNTDAEGRLVLCDALSEADSENPDVIFDFATLTGACRVALGTELPGYFCNDEALARELFEHGNKVKDQVWQLPLHKPYEDMLRSDIADTLNSAPTGFGGAITAALYLQKFVSKDTPWVHFDVMAWNNRKLPGRPIGGEAFGIRAVFDYLQSRYK